MNSQSFSIYKSGINFYFLIHIMQEKEEEEKVVYTN